VSRVPDRYVYNSNGKDPSETHPQSPVPFSHFRGVFSKKKGDSGSEVTMTRSNKQVLVIDDDYDSALTVKSCLEIYHRQDTEESAASEFQPIQVTTYTDPLLALKEFKPYYYDLLLVDINMPLIDGYELVEKIVKLDLNIKVCFLTAGEINYEAIREIRHPIQSFGCFIKKPASSTDLVHRVLQELY
jgi:CheY-like chemotaxis protein